MAGSQQPAVGSSGSGGGEIRSFCNDVSANYDRMMAGCSLRLAHAMVAGLADVQQQQQQLQFPPASASASSAAGGPVPIDSADAHVLDNACGTGAVTEAVKARHPAARVLGADAAPAMLAAYAAKGAARGWAGGAEARRLDVRDLAGLADGSFSHVITSLGIWADLEDETAAWTACGEVRRVLREGGVAVTSTWANRGFPQALWNAHDRLRPDRPEEKKMMNKRDWLNGSQLVTMLEKGGFGHNIVLRPFANYMEATLDELVDNLIGGRALMLPAAYASGQEEARFREILREEVQKLDTFRMLPGEEGEGSGGKDGKGAGLARLEMVNWVAYAWKVPGGDNYT